MRYLGPEVQSDLEPDAARRAREDANRRLIAAISVFAPTAGPLFVSFLFTPDVVESGHVVLSAPCMFKAVFGLGCPTCGMTRAFLALSHGDLVRALNYNLASPIVYLIFWGLAAHALYGLIPAVIDRWGWWRRPVRA